MHEMSFFVQLHRDYQAVATNEFPQASAMKDQTCETMERKSGRAGDTQCCRSDWCCVLKETYGNAQLQTVLCLLRKFEHHRHAFALIILDANTPYYLSLCFQV